MKARKQKEWCDFSHMAFDIDGTLLNSNIAHVWAWQDAIEKENLFLPHTTLFLQMGLPGNQILEKFSYVFKDKIVAKRIGENAAKFYIEKYVDLIAPYDGVYDFLSLLKSNRRKIYALTSASSGEANSMLKRFKLNPYFDLVLTKEDLGAGKPTAEPFLKLRERLGTKADLISFGDSPFDLKASSAAGVPFVYLGHGGFPREWFSKARACFFNINHILESFKAREKASMKTAAA
ncbi:MAG: HAD-IA family hydrolase [Bdellovibrionota bacterium]